MAYADVTDIHTPLVDRFAELGHPWPVLYGYRARWEQRGNKALVGGDVVIYAGDATGRLGPIDAAGEQVFVAGPSIGTWHQLLGIQVNAAADLPSSTSSQDRQKADDKLAICIVDAVLSALHDILPGGADDSAGGHHHELDQEPTIVARSRQQSYGVSIELVAAIDFSVRNIDGRSVVDNLIPFPAATAQAGDDEAEILNLHP